MTLHRSLISFLVALVAACSAVLVGAPSASAADTIAVDGTATGRVFDGVGAISGGGGNTRLLIDYPEPYRSQILDYLFKPGYGAALQILKVEIGGDTNSTDGAESSHEHVRGDLDCTRGYEWWLMEQARARNPSIKLAGLAWGAPGWLGGGNFWSTDTVQYLVDWLGCARQHGLDIDSLGGWNERDPDPTFYKNLHAALRSNGYATRVVAADHYVGWQIADELAADPSFAAAVDIIGVHYQCGYLTAMTSCSSSATAIASGKPLWASENGSLDYDEGGQAVARAINRGYIDAKMTAYINWPLIASIAPNEPFNTAGLILANEPWSGWYDLGRTVWASAHTTQVTQPGWRYLDSASGYFGGDRANGSYVTLQAPDDSAWSTIAETLDATAARTVSFNVSGGLPTGTVHVWASNMRTKGSSDKFLHVQDITPSSGSFSLTLEPGSLYSITTTTGQGKGTAASPPQAALGLPVSNSYETTAIGQEPTLLAQQQGAFEAAACGGGRPGRCLRQMAPIAPIKWETTSSPYTLIGSPAWRDYTVSTDALFESDSTVQVLGRVARLTRNVGNYDGYGFEVSSTGAWSIVRHSANGATTTTLASGSVPALGTDTWHSLSARFDGPTITGTIDGTVAGSATDSALANGQAGLGVGQYATDEFDNLAVTPVGTFTSPVAYQVINVGSGKALTHDASGGLIQATPTGEPTQVWTLTGDTSGWLTLTNTATGRVVDQAGQDTSAGRQLTEWPANGGTNQQWQLRPKGDGTYTLVVRNGQLLADVDGGSTVDGAAVVQGTDTGATSQQWRLERVLVPEMTVAQRSR